MKPSLRTIKAVRKRIDERIEAAFNARCKGVQISVLDMGEIYAAGYAALSAGPLSEEALGDAIAAFVQTIRKN